MKPDTYDEVVAQRDAARAAVKAWEDKEASRGMCCWQMEQERDAARAEAARLKEYVAEIDDEAVEAVGTPSEYNNGELQWQGRYTQLWRLIARMKRAEAEAARLREAIQAALDSPNHMGSEDIDILLAALKWEGR